MTLSISIMASPARAEFIPYLKEKLGEVPVAMDSEGKGEWENCKAAWRLQNMNSDWSVVIQDDAIVCDNFTERAEEAIANAKQLLNTEDFAVNFYYGYRRSDRENAEGALRRGYWLNKYPKWGVAICLPTKYIEEMISFCEANNNPDWKTRDDVRIGAYIGHKELQVYFPLPSLIDHRKGKSLVGDPGENRQAYAYIDREIDLSKTDFVYILGNGSRWQDNEIKYSLRSLQNVPHGRVVVVGTKPDFLKNVLHIPAEDDMGNKLQNAISKIRKACENEEISADFVLMNDDFFFLRKTNTLPNFTNGTLAELEENHNTAEGYYYEAICDTIELLADAGVPSPKNFEVHLPMIFNRKRFLCVTDLVNWQEAPPYLFRSMYGNLSGLKTEERKDVKIYKAEELVKFLELDILSSDNAVTSSPMFRRWIGRKFFTPSPYER